MMSNELDLLEIRLNTLDSVVDYFVIVEATTNFQNKAKPLYFEKNKERYNLFLHKIIHIVVDDMPNSFNTRELEAFQRNAIIRGLTKCEPDDQIIVSDLDEIPNPEKIHIAATYDGYKGFVQHLYYYYINYACIEMQHLPWSIMSSYKLFDGAQNMRNRIMKEQSNILTRQKDNELVLIENGGWHFSYLGGVDAIINKLNSIADPEYKKDKYKNKQYIEKAINTGKDLYGRDLSFEYKELNDNFPAYLIRNAQLYSDFILDCKHVLIKNFGPRTVSAANNAIWVTADHLKSDSKIYYGNIELETCIDKENGVITATVPDFIFRFDTGKQFSVITPSDGSTPCELDISLEVCGENCRNSLSELYDRLFELEANELRNSKKSLPIFDGWGMTTFHKNPWDDNYDLSSFRECMKDLKNNFIFGLEKSIGINSTNVDSLKWRHYVVNFCTRYALIFNNKNKQLNFIECGVGDGMTAFVSLYELTGNDVDYKFHLFDSWSQMENASLDKSERFLEEHYGDLDIERTKTNLEQFVHHCVYYEGLIPNTLKDYNEDNKVNYLHIDLNSVNATISVLDFFIPKMKHGSIVLFDDYGWHGYDSTKDLVDKYFVEKPGMLLKLPTGQAIYML